MDINDIQKYIKNISLHRKYNVNNFFVKNKNHKFKSLESVSKKCSDELYSILCENISYYKLNDNDISYFKYKDYTYSIFISSNIIEIDII